MFFKKKKEVVVHAYTARAEIFDHAKLKTAATKKPDWWKNLKNCRESADKQNMKTCAGFNDLYANSITVPLWSDLILEYAGKGEDWWKYRYADRASDAGVHDPKMKEGWADNYMYQHVKLNSPWKLTCDEDIKFLYTNAAYENESPLDWFVMNGVLSFSRQHAIEINMLLKRGEKAKELFLPFGHPMAMLVPMTERKVRIEHHLVTNEEWQRIADRSAKRLAFKSSYYKLNKCPFSRGEND
jgi:hypothetical protein